MENQLQICSFEQAKRLKELGFDWECNSYFELDGSLINHQDYWDYNGEEYYQWSGDIGVTSAPTVALALQFIRNNKNVFSCVDFAVANFRKGYYWNYFSFENKDICDKTDDLFGSYELAESALLNKLLTILEKQL